MTGGEIAAAAFGSLAMTEKGPPRNDRGRDCPAVVYTWRDPAMRSMRRGRGCLSSFAKATEDKSGSLAMTE